MNDNESWQSFSRRNHFAQEEPGVTVWEDAPEGFRFVLLSAAVETLNLSPSNLRSIVCRVLRERPDPSNWSEYPNIWGELEGLVYHCEWFRVYDIVEAIIKSSEYVTPHRKNDFEREINDCLRDKGIGWQLKEGLVQARGEESYEQLVAEATDTLKAAKMPTAQSELSEALKDLSRRPTPDLSGAVHHAMAALECVAREVTGLQKATLGQIISGAKNPLPKPLDEAMEKVWGYASEHARHGRENRSISRAEAQLVVGLSSSIIVYLLHKTEAVRP